MLSPAGNTGSRGHRRCDRGHATKSYRSAAVGHAVRWRLVGAQIAEINSDLQWNNAPVELANIHALRSGMIRNDQE